MPAQFCYCILVSQPPYFLVTLSVYTGSYRWRLVSCATLRLKGLVHFDGRRFGAHLAPAISEQTILFISFPLSEQIKSDKCSTRTMLHHDRTTNGFTQLLHHLCLRIAIGFLFELSLLTLALYQNWSRYATGRFAEQHDKPLVLC
jgi:hypothetical protein